MSRFCCLSFRDLSEETQNELLCVVKKLLKAEQEEEIREEAKILNIGYEILLQEKAELFIRTYSFSFNE